MPRVRSVPMRRLANATELLDGPLTDEAALIGTLTDLRRVNRWLGGSAISARAVDALLEPSVSRVSLLDVGTGGADIPIHLVRRFARTGRSLAVLGVDAREEVLAAARTLHPRLPESTAIELAVTDGRSLPYPDGSFDIVHSSLLMHHLEPRDAVAFLRESRRVARRGVIVNDLVRARLHWVVARVLFTLGTRNPLSRHDGPVSVQRSYTRVELRALLAAAGLHPVAEAAAVAGHRVAIAARATGRPTWEAPGTRTEAGSRANDPA